MLLAIHLALVLWIATRNSVTFDENFHLPAGVVALTRGDFTTSYAQPPLARALAGAVALAVGARQPDPASERPGDERALGRSFMLRNADRYERIFFAGRLVTAALSTLLGLLLWRLARRWYGEWAGLLALAAWTFAPEALAHASVVGVDVPTALATFGVAISGFAWLRTGSWRRWILCALWMAAAFLVRFSAAQLLPMLAVLAALLAWRGRLADARKTVLGMLLLGIVALVAVNVGYRFQGSGSSLRAYGFLSNRFQSFQHQWPGWHVPLPRGYVMGLDYLSFLSQPGEKQGYFLGHTRLGHDWRYFPVAIAVKWPVGLLGLVGLGLVYRLRRRVRLDRDFALLVPAGTVLLTAMSSNLDYGVRYVLPALPFLCVYAAAPVLEVARHRGARAWATAAIVMVALEGAESARGWPYPLAFFNVFAGGPGAGDRIVNDSNVDWGQGLTALRHEMQVRGIHRLQLVYHGTTEPSLYGIDYVPFFTGAVDSTVDYLAISSYFMVGLSARLSLKDGFSDVHAYDWSGLQGRVPEARPANCMYLYRIR